MKELLLLSLLIPLHTLASSDSVCGEDSRTNTVDQKIGRLSNNNKPTCTVTMIGKECALSAGHCADFFATGIVEFNVPMSIDHQIQKADPKNTYQIDMSSVKFSNNGPGRDWSVFKLIPNKLTKSLAGDVNGYYPLSREQAQAQTAIQIAGYGTDDRQGSLNGTLQIAFGKITEIQELEDGGTAIVIAHDVDSTPGDSGAVIIRSKQKDIIGIHTHGGIQCPMDPNQGTLITNKKLQVAISACLNSK